jgi:hypothetical protein
MVRSPHYAVVRAMADCTWLPCRLQLIDRCPGVRAPDVRTVPCVPGQGASVSAAALWPVIPTLRLRLRHDRGLAPHHQVCYIAVRRLPHARASEDGDRCAT